MLQFFRCALFVAIAVLIASCASRPRSGVKNTSRTFKTVVVDPGHGGKDSGAVRRYGGPEKVAALDVAQRLNRKLRESQLKTVMTRSSDVLVHLERRVSISNKKKNAIFVSIHFNDSRRRAIRGFETYYFSPASRPLAQRIQQKLLTIRGSANRGVHFGSFHVLRNAKYPAVLVECGFLSNRKEGRGARDADYRELLADKIAEAIVEQRYGPGVYSAPPATAPLPTPAPPAEGVNTGPQSSP